MKTWALALIVSLFSFGLAVFDADAKRFGGARSVGKQRQSIDQRYSAPRPPAQQQQAAPATPPAQQPSAASRWLGPLAGLALGAGLAALFLHNGLGGALAGILLLAAIVAGAIFLVRALRGRPQPQRPMEYAAAGPANHVPVEPVFRPTSVPAPGSVAATTGGLAAARALPPDFDAPEFLRHAKQNFVRLQAANDAGNAASIREVVTDELYREIEADLRSRGEAPQRTEVVTLDAEVLDVSTEGDRYVVSVRFHGLIRENADEAAPFTEIWHLEKPVSGASGWLVAGIQQA